MDFLIWEILITDPYLLSSIFQQAAHMDTGNERRSHPQKTMKDLVQSYAWFIAISSFFHLILSSFYLFIYFYYYFFFFHIWRVFLCIFVRSLEILHSSWGFHILGDLELEGEKLKNVHAWVWRPHVSTGIMHSLYKIFNFRYSDYIHHVWLQRKSNK